MLSLRDTYIVVMVEEIQTFKGAGGKTKPLHSRQCEQKPFSVIRAKRRGWKRMQGADHVRYARVSGVAELTFLSQEFKDCLGDRLTGLGLSTSCL